MYTVLNKYYQNEYFKDKVLLKSFEENNNLKEIYIDTENNYIIFVLNRGSENSLSQFLKIEKLDFNYKNDYSTKIFKYLEDKLKLESNKQ